MNLRTEAFHYLYNIYSIQSQSILLPYRIGGFNVKRNESELDAARLDVRIRIRYSMCSQRTPILEMSGKRFYFIPDEGVKNMTAKQARKVACDDPDYFGRDLYNAIQICSPPSWTVKSKIDDYIRDGVPPVRKNSGGKPNHYPNTFHGSIAPKKKNKCKLIEIKESTETNNMDQMRKFYQNLSEAERKRLPEAIAETLSLTVEYLQKKGVRVFGDINPELGNQVAEELEKKKRKAN
ncbi:hypothetical protein K1T71_006278 [Dendrolimus kikuchii]|uniref:Uncharacterized protein n=1 Tax=Dendrolimus kikuchii TaxID=765133 RepID=A0ACC1D3K5_9NEOP|nr:hypothetical protein K1T71_006278 [Dendrolimus kikuchii]